MKRIAMATVVACVLALPALADKTSKGGNAEFKELIDRYASTWNSLNPDNAAVLYAKDPDLVFFDLAPLKYAGWNEYEKGTREMFAGFESLKLTPNDDLRVNRQGKFAWTTVTMHAAVKMKDGGPMEMDARQTLIWEKRDGKWVVVHEHFSAPLPKEEAKKD